MNIFPEKYVHSCDGEFEVVLPVDSYGSCTVNKDFISLHDEELVVHKSIIVLI